MRPPWCSKSWAGLFFWSVRVQIFALGRGVCLYFWKGFPMGIADMGRVSSQRRILLLLERVASRRFGVSVEELRQEEFAGYCVRTLRRDLRLLAEFGLIERTMRINRNGRNGLVVLRSKKTLDLFCESSQHEVRKTIH